LVQPISLHPMSPKFPRTLSARGGLLGHPLPSLSEAAASFKGQLYNL
jgi:hypothetical protein